MNSKIVVLVIAVLLGPGVASSRLVGSNADGGVEVFVRATDNALWHQRQLPEGGSTWSGWAPLGGMLTSDPVVAHCPGCGHPNIVVWRKATPYSVSLTQSSK